MTGGGGDDIYSVDTMGDTVTEGGGALAGFDTVRSSVTSYTLGSNFERLVLQGSALNGTGNVLDNILIGNAPATG